MRYYYICIKDLLGMYKDELGLLFLQRPVEGSFFSFESGISQQNGKLASFENPEYVKATIKIDRIGAEYILSQERFDFDDKYIFDFAKSFCIGASISYKE